MRMKLNGMTLDANGLSFNFLGLSPLGQFSGI